MFKLNSVLKLSHLGTWEYPCSVWRCAVRGLARTVLLSEAKGAARAGSHPLGEKLFVGKGLLPSTLQTLFWTRILLCQGNRYITQHAQPRRPPRVCNFLTANEHILLYFTWLIIIFSYIYPRSSCADAYKHKREMQIRLSIERLKLTNFFDNPFLNIKFHLSWNKMGLKSSQEC